LFHTVIHLMERINFQWILSNFMEVSFIFIDKPPFLFL
jgi:hypothetical protein